MAFRALKGLSTLHFFVMMAAAQETAALDEIIVTSSKRDGAAVTLLDAAAIRASATPRVDEVLAVIPGITLFRRVGSRLAHPTAQGVTMRGIGPSGAGRTLVLLDGVPQNDPFGGWVSWSALDAGGVSSISVIKGAVAGSGGNQALGGVISLRSEMTEGMKARIVYGSDDTIEGALWAGGKIGGMNGDVYLARERSDGPWLLRAQDRGPVDQRANSSSWRAAARGELELGQARVRFELRHFEDQRRNGTELTANQTQGTDASVHLDGETVDAVVWWKDRDFSSAFSSVSAPRDTETPSLDQYAVPSRGLGASLSVKFGAFRIGTDVREERGETRELFRFISGNFTRDRRAGGRNLMAGAWADGGFEFGDTRLSAGIRADIWRMRNPHRLERDQANGATLRDDPLLNRSGSEVTGRISVDHRIGTDLRLTAAAYSGWRLPSLNELYRPFRVRNDVTEANPALAPEQLKGFDLGAAFEGDGPVTASATFYWNRLEHGIGNVTVGLGPGSWLGNFVPAGGSVRQRVNIDLIRVLGLESELTWHVREEFDLTLRHLFSSTKVARFAADPNLVGKRLAQVPRHSATLTARWQPVETLSLNSDLIWRGQAYDDDQNNRSLASVVTVNARAMWTLDPALRFSLTTRNLFDRHVISAVSGDGLQTLAEPRSATFELNMSF